MGGVAAGVTYPDHSCMHTCPDRKSTRLNSSHPSISYAVFCLKKKKKLYKNFMRRKDTIKNRYSRNIVLSYSTFTVQITNIFLLIRCPTAHLHMTIIDHDCDKK